MLGFSLNNAKERVEMNLSKIGNGTVFNNAMVKMILNKNSIDNILQDFSIKDVSRMEEQECLYCKKGVMCRKHSAFQRVLDTNKAVQFLSDSFPPNIMVLGSKSDIFCYNDKNKSMLILDCPPITIKKNHLISDKWVRKFVPFTLPNVQNFVVPEISQSVDLDKLFSHELLYVNIKVKNELYRLELYNVFGSFVWKLSLSLNNLDRNNDYPQQEEEEDPEINNDKLSIVRNQR